MPCLRFMGWWSNVPNRIIKESICTSDSIDHLSIEAERLFYRLIVNCDDYGVLDARLPIIKSKCFPLKSSDITDNQLHSWLVELEAQQMVFFYENSGHEYLKMSSWERHQQIRAKRPKYPLPGDENSHKISSEIIGNQMITNVPVIQSNPIQSNTKSESNTESQKADETSCPYSEIQSLYSSICKSYPKLTKLSDSRKKAIHARFAAGYTLDDFKRLFEMAESSQFLKGQNNRNWSANFDWLIKDANIAKVLEGNYNNKGGDSNARQSPNNAGNNGSCAGSGAAEVPQYGKVY